MWCKLKFLFLQSWLAIILFISTSTLLAQSTTTLSLPSPFGRISDLAVTPDGEVWFTQADWSKIGKISTSGQITEYPYADGPFMVSSITTGLGSVWVTMWHLDTEVGKIQRLSLNGVNERWYDLPRYSRPSDIVVSTDGTLWLTGRDAEYSPVIFRMTVAGELTEHKMSVNPTELLAASDGKVWFIAPGSSEIGYFNGNGEIRRFTVMGANGGLDDLTEARGGTVWFSQNLVNRLGKIDSEGNMTHYPVPPVAGESGPEKLIADNQGEGVWFSHGRLFRSISSSGQITGEIQLSHRPTEIASGAGGMVWFGTDQPTVVRAQLSGGPIGAA